jgi:hypothetical protein
MKLFCGAVLVALYVRHSRRVPFPINEVATQLGD